LFKYIYCELRHAIRQLKYFGTDPLLQLKFGTYYDESKFHSNLQTFSDHTQTVMIMQVNF